MNWTLNEQQITTLFKNISSETYVLFLSQSGEESLTSAELYFIQYWRDKKLPDELINVLYQGKTMKIEGLYPFHWDIFAKEWIELNFTTAEEAMQESKNQYLRYIKKDHYFSSNEFDYLKGYIAKIESIEQFSRTKDISNETLGQLVKHLMLGQ
ncbi:hypothetical protein SporoP8_07065 [Sporosarcina ureae]|uniref:DnaD domain protein n=1 Tax=Sporosarcina ureae TaxID=1571 RepID=UPI000A15D820|nr:DnaD domain protein [Sporosarcina ureae]ARJ38650.1 hypothetical protein SporoP8_07065 [Sporosarcina ureae]